MNLLVTAGGTVVPIDRVRCISNSFTGRTGAKIALHAHRRGHCVTLLTSHPDAVANIDDAIPSDERWTIRPYRTFDDLQAAMAECLTSGGFDGLVHSAAVSDYRVAGIYSLSDETTFQVGIEENVFFASYCPKLINQSAGKVKSNHSELWLRLVQAPKLVDLIRSDWKFDGIIVKFKLEVDVDDVQLLDTAERSRIHSRADLMVANTLDGAKTFAFFGPTNGVYERISRTGLPSRLIEAVERLHRERTHG
jgi:phosphopantothenoylcysteine synthetase/decarboxylase